MAKSRITQMTIQEADNHPKIIPRGKYVDTTCTKCGESKQTPGYTLHTDIAKGGCITLECKTCRQETPQVLKSRYILYVPGFLTPTMIGVVRE